jgi:hypothetical protein
MLCFDKLKIITSTNHIKDIDENVFQTNLMSGILQYHKYQQKKTSSLLIMNNYEKNELVIEFTSKILKDNFIHLINRNNIRECLSNINRLNICTLDIDSIINNSETVKCNPVKDVTFYESMKALKNHTNYNLSNYDKWKSKSYQNGFTVENTASTPRNKHRIVIYGKAKELDKANNQSFLDTLSNKEKCLSHYEDKVRIELNINTKPQIRELLNISDNKLMSVLNSAANPILTVLNKALKEPSANTHVIRTWKEYQIELVLKDCDYDLSKVEAKVRSLYSKNTQIAKVMKPYRELHHRLFNNTAPAFDVRKLVV